MLVNPGDLIPVLPSATALPWTRRKSQILNYLHRGPVTFSTLVYDTNVGDISAIATYFNPERVSVHDLNSRFGHYPESGNLSGEVVQDSGAPQNALSVRPRLLLYPEHNLNHKQVTVQRTLKWVLSQDGKESTGSSPTPRDEMNSPLVPSDIPVPHSPRLNPMHATAPASLASRLDNVWGVVGEGRSRAVGDSRSRGDSRGSGDMARSRGSSADWFNSEESLLPRWDIGEDPVVPRWDIGEGIKGDQTWATWGSNQLFENMLKAF